jgi:YidC/Oxa1 family membrane protein insertase
MQQKMMTFMMLFFAVMFFKVPSGLCLYFIASSIWTLAEHKVLKKNKLAPAAALATTARGK